MFSIWTILFTILIVELILNLILVVQIFTFLRKGIIRFLRFFFRNTALQTTAIIIAILMVYSFGFSYYTQMRLTAELDADTESGSGIIIDATKELSIRVRVFREQRNMYLSGFAFFHGIVLWRIIKLYDQFDKDCKEANKNERELKQPDAAREPKPEQPSEKIE